MATTTSNSNISALIEEQSMPPQDGVAQSGSTTNFVNDSAVVQHNAISEPIDLGRMFNANLDIYRHQDIKEFMRKPISLATGIFSVTDLPVGIQQTYDLYNLYLQNDIIQQKIKGHLGIRGKFVIRIIVNGNRFQQGRYFLAFFNTAGAISASQDAPWLNLHTATLCQRTQLPKVSIDINRDTEAVFEVPFISAYSHMLVKGSNVVYTNPGKFLLCCYSPLVAPTGSTIATYSIYGHMEDVDLVTPTVPQARINFKSSAKSIRSTGNQDHQRNEQEQANLGPITSTLRNVSKAADIVAKIPMLSAIAAPVAWFTDISASVANVFGWSNPLDLSEVTRAIQTIIPYANNVDMPDAAMPLALYARNTIEVLPGLGGTDIDEMSIDYLKTIPAYFVSFDLNTANVNGERIWRDFLAPVNFTTTIVDNSRTVVGWTPVAYLSQFFNYYRGGFIFKFHVVSTEFHSGRYSVDFYPAEGRISTTISFAQAPYVHREIIDLREGNEFTFHVPYTSISNYRPTNQPFGGIAVHCINPLVAPASVSSVVKVLVEVCGAPDFEYAGLTTGLHTLNAPSAPQSNINFAPKVDSITEGTIGDSDLTDDRLLNSRHCMGEKVMSVLTILKHNNQFVTPDQGTTATAGAIAPFGINAYGFGGAINNDSPFKSDLYSMISAMYAMSRGAVRWKVFNNAVVDANTTEITSATVEFKRTGNVNLIMEQITPFPPVRWALKVIQNSIYRGCVDIQTPPYHDTFARTNLNEIVGNGNTWWKSYADFSSNSMSINVNTATANGNIYYRQCADDFQLSSFISTPCTYSS